MATVTTVLAIIYGLTVGLLYSRSNTEPGRLQRGFTVFGGLLVGVLAIIFLLIPFIRGTLS